MIWSGDSVLVVTLLYHAMVPYRMNLHGAVMHAGATDCVSSLNKSKIIEKWGEMKPYRTHGRRSWTTETNKRDDNRKGKLVSYPSASVRKWPKEGWELKFCSAMLGLDLIGASRIWSRGLKVKVKTVQWKWVRRCKNHLRSWFRCIV